MKISQNVFFSAFTPVWFLYQLEVYEDEQTTLYHLYY